MNIIKDALTKTVELLYAIVYGLAAAVVTVMAGELAVLQATAGEDPAALHRWTPTVLGAGLTAGIIASAWIRSRQRRHRLSMLPMQASRAGVAGKHATPTELGSRADRCADEGSRPAPGPSSLSPCSSLQPRERPSDRYARILQESRARAEDRLDEALGQGRR